MADTKTTARPERIEVMLNRIIMAASRGESARADERAIVERVTAGDAAQAERDALAKALADAEAREAGLREALHDAIVRPCGAVPQSAQPFYEPARAIRAEARRPKHESVQERQERYFAEEQAGLPGARS